MNDQDKTKCGERHPNLPGCEGTKFFLTQGKDYIDTTCAWCEVTIRYLIQKG
jgi:predicted nucleic-acid-binding Zn-ribbon protein